LSEDQQLAAAEFSPKSRMTIDKAIAIHKKRLDKMFEATVNAEVRRRIDTADNFAREDNKRLRQEILGNQRILAQKAALSIEQFNMLRRCLHPDRIQRFGDPHMIEQFARAAQLLAEKKKSLTGVS
jgi:hypothetical protein